jgi:succinylarginine dihydrolase
MNPRTYNFDGIVGPTHGYGGLSEGNLASIRHRGAAANPRAAALQGLAKMRRVTELGGAQCVLPPQPRPDPDWLRRLGFTGTDSQVLEKALSQAPELLTRASSASAMWTANAATVAPSCDTEDHRVHLTVANLGSMPHRALEAETTARVLQRIFADSERFVVHPPLPSTPLFFDEGAANHTRFVTQHGALHLFAWGRRGLRRDATSSLPDEPRKHPARQGEEASRAVARLHRLADGSALFWQQSPRGIDGGAFHTDVLAVGEGSFFMLHEAAFAEQAGLLAELRARLGRELIVCEAAEGELPLADAVQAYPFNSELVERADGSLVILAPSEAWQLPSSRRFLERVRSEENPVEAIDVIDVNASMNNGGGPACLRLRVPLEVLERSALGARVGYDEELHQALESWVLRHYRDRLTLDDLKAPELLDEVRRALDELTQLLELGSVYSFQRA